MATKLFKKEKAHGDSIWAVAWKTLQNGQDVILTGSCDESVIVWNVKDDGHDLEKRMTFTGHHLGVLSLSVSATEDIAVSSSMDSRIRILDLNSGNVIRTIDAGPIECWHVACSPDGKHVASGTYTGAVNIWDIESGKLLKTLETNNSFVLSLAYASDGKTLSCSTKDGAVFVFDCESEKVLCTLLHHSQPIRSICYTPESQVLYSGSDDLNICICDCTGNGSLLGTLRGHLGWVVSVAINADGSFLATGSTDKTVRVWDLKERKCVQTLDKCHTEQVFAVVFSPSGKHFVSVGGEGNLQIYVLNSGNTSIE